MNHNAKIEVKPEAPQDTPEGKTEEGPPEGRGVGQISVHALSRHIQCKFPTCNTAFQPKRRHQEFCSPGCRKEYHAEARRRGEAQMANGKETRRNTGNIKSSPRLRRVFDFLSDMEEHTTREVERGADVSAAGACCTDLRLNLTRDDLPSEYRGYRLPPARWSRRNGVKVAVYCMEQVQKEPQTPALCEGCGWPGIGRCFVCGDDPKPQEGQIGML